MSGLRMKFADLPNLQDDSQIYWVRNLNHFEKNLGIFPELIAELIWVSECPFWRIYPSKQEPWKFEVLSH